MKKTISALAVTTMLGMTTVLGANPFTDVTPQDWAYQAVARLASQGVVNGYPDGTFQGGNNITRFEMAQMVAKALNQQDRMNGEQQAVLNKLAQEFSEELHNLGVRVENLERKVGNVSFTGEMRFRFDGQQEHGIYLNAPADNTKIKVNGKEVTLNKGMHEVHFSGDTIDGAGKLDVQSDAIGPSVDGNEAATAFLRGLASDQVHNGQGFVESYKEANKPLNPDFKDQIELWKNALRVFTVNLNIPDTATNYEAMKMVYEAAQPHKKGLGDKYTEIENRYQAYYEGSKLPEYIYNLSQQYGLKGKKQSTTSYRVRVNAMADVNEHTKFGIRLAQESEFGAGTQKQTEVDRLWVSHRFGTSQVMAGRLGAMFGDGLVFDGDFDGIIGTTKLGTTKLTVGYGYPTELTTNAKEIGQIMTYGQLQAPITKHISGKVYMASLNSHKAPNNALAQAFIGSHVGFSHRIYGVALLGDHGRFGWNGEYAKRTAGEDNKMALPVLREGKGRNAWMVGTRYNYGDVTLGLQYFHLGQNSPILASSTYDARYIKNWKGFVATVNYAFDKNANVKVGYAFKGSPVEIYHGAVAPAAKYFGQVEYKF
ncbi:S-layer homology domain-containing protein [Veillonella sp. VA139]|uniref:S-layer homology domain-containing protein n=1 Tax=Veillonella sp. VA139 TaxID=741830 RepID=UPI000F8CB1A3